MEFLTILTFCFLQPIQALNVNFRVQIKEFDLLIFSCEEAALEVQMLSVSDCLSVRL